MADIQERLAKLTPDQRAAFERRAHGLGVRGARAGIPRRSSALVPSPLSFSQQRLWFLDQIAPGSPFYLVVQAMRLRGKLRPALLRQALQSLIDRHEALRTAFVMDKEGVPHQVPQADARVPFAVVDLSLAPLEQRDALLQSLAQAEARRPFALNEPPLIRSMLLCCGPEDHVWVLTMHHIVSDAWSLNILIRDVAACYEASLHGVRAMLPHLPLQYADYAVWQRALLSEAAFSSRVAYWCERLADAPLLKLPLDRPRPRVAQYAGASVWQRAPESLTAAVLKLSAEAEATLFMTLLAAWQVLLARRSGQTDIVVGTPIANREQPEVQSLIGFFINTLVLRVDLGGAPSFREALQRVREVALGAYAHQDVPFDVVVERLRPERDLSRNPIFQVEFQLHEQPTQAFHLAGIEISPFGIEVASTRFDIELHAYFYAEQLQFHLLYDKSLFDASTMSRMLTQYLRLLESAVREPDRPMDRLSMLDAAEREELLVAWNATERKWTTASGADAQGSAVAALVESQAAVTPDRIAAISGNHHVSYAEMLSRARHVAAELMRRGIGADHRVGVCIGRGIDLGVAVLGVLEAGGAYVPLDPLYPAARLDYMTRDSALSAVIARGAMARQRGLTEQCLEIDLDSALASTLPDDMPSPHVPPGCLGYIIYTSGSTGMPKGIALSQEALVNLLHWYADVLPSASRMLQLTSISFDASFVDLFHTWSTGGTLIWVDEDTVRDASELASIVESERIEKLMLPAMLLNLLTEQLGDGGQSLRDVISTAEPLYLTSALTEWFTRHDCRLHNQYGPSETHVITHYTCVGEAYRWPVAPPIGRAISNAQLYVLDHIYEPVPIGAVGELYIGGVSLARGYHGKPALTAERFIPSPFGPPGARLYRSGDRVRFRVTGDVEFVERADDQVKIRGFRIELGEVQSVVAKQPGVAAAVVVAREIRTGERGLVAYVVAKPPDASLTVDTLRRGVAERLPAYMVPAAFVILPSLPVTPSGKVDRRMLPAPEDTLRHVISSSVAPRTPLEQRLVTLWAQVLSVERVGIDDNFFDLGGHSLLATQLAIRIRSACEVQVRVRDIFEHSTIRALAQFLETPGTEQPVAEQKIPRIDRDRPLPLSRAQQRIWFLEQLYPGKPTYNLPSSLRMTGALDIAALKRAFTEVVARHEILRTTFHPDETEPVQKVHPPSPFPLPLIDVTNLQDDDRKEALMRHLVRTLAARVFDLQQGPLVRACLIREAPNTHVFVLALHHLISDGWSESVLRRELSSAYAAFRTAQVPTLPPLPIQYADFAAWQHEHLRDREFQEQVAFWQRQLADTSGVLNLPTDHARPPVATQRGSMETIELRGSIARRVQDRSREWGGTPFMLLLACWQTLLWRYSGDADILVATPIAGRTRSEFEGLIGMFVNMLVMRTRFSSEWTFVDLFAHVREMAMESYAHQDVPFEFLVEKLRVQRDLSRTPLTQVQFVLQNTPRARLVLPDLALSPIVEDIGVSKYDLSLAVVPRGESLSATMEYSTDLFSRERIIRMLRQFEHLLDTVLTTPSQCLANIPLMLDEEWRALQQSNRVESVPPQASSLHEAVERQARTCPDRTAVVFDDTHLTYGALDLRATELANTLRAAGVKPEHAVAVSLPRSLEMAVAVIAILKSGAAFVPLDEEMPHDQALAILKHAEPAAIVTDVRGSERLVSYRVPVVLVDALRSDGETSSPDLPSVTQAYLASVTYVSDGISELSGVMNTHGAAMNQLLALQQMAPLNATDVMAHMLPIDLLVSVLHLLWPLTMGASVVVAPNASSQPDTLSELMRRAGATITHLPTRVLDSYLAEARYPRVPSLRTLLCSGEPLTAERRRRTHAVFDDVIYVRGNSAIPTLTGCSGDNTQRHPIVIGRPCTSTRAYVLDQRGQPAPIGVPGELYVGGASLPRAYRAQPALTALRFVPDPFSNQPGARLYRTGDIVRHREDGQLELSGRAEDRLTLDGYRLDLLEIESALAEHSGVQSAAVLAKADAGGIMRPTAYVVRSPASSATGPQLLSFLDARLPEYMRPAAITFVDRISLTRHGSVDRESLRSVPVRLDGQRHQAREPTDALELQLTRLWSDVLGVPVVDTRRSFFQLGGQSLLAVRLAWRVERHFGIPVAVESLFLEPTIEGFARLLRTQAGGDELWKSLVAVQPRGRLRPLFCMPPLGFTVTQYRALSERLGSDQPVYACQGRPLHEWHSPARMTLQQLAAADIQDIKTVQPRGPYRLAGWSSGGLLAFEMAQQLRQADEQVEVLAMFDTWAPGSRRKYDAAEVLRMVVQAMTINLGAERVIDIEHLRSLPPDRRLKYAIDEIVRAGLMDDVADRARLERAVDGLWGLQQLPVAYEAKPYDGNLLLFRAARFSSGELAELEAEGLHPEHPILRYRGWDRWVTPPPEVCEVPTSHAQIVLEPHVRWVAERLQRALGYEHSSFSHCESESV